MSENASERGKEKGKGTGEGPSDDSKYIIDETVTVTKDESIESWDLDYDPQDEEAHVIRAIGRTNSTQVQAFILPKEEFEFFKDGENVWTEYKSKKSDRISVTAKIDHTDEDPYYHGGDYVLVIETTGNHGSPDELKFSVKYRRE